MKFLIVKSAVTGANGEHLKPGCYEIGDKLTLDQAKAIASGGRAHLSSSKPAKEPAKEPVKEPAEEPVKEPAEEPADKKPSGKATK